MNKKGQGIGIIFITFMAVIVGILLFQVIAQQVGDATTSSSLALYSLGTQVNGTTYYITGYKYLDGVTVYGNGTTAPVALETTEYTITNNVIDPTTQSLSVSILPNSAYTNTTWRLNATTAYESDYIDNAGARSIALLISIFFALAVAVTALVPSMREGIMNLIKN